MERYDPLFNNPMSQPARTAVAAADVANEQPHLVAASEPPPKSPMSNTPMVLAEIGLPGKPAINVWVSLEDRIVFPARKG